MLAHDVATGGQLLDIAQGQLARVGARRQAQGEVVACAGRLRLACWLSHKQACAGRELRGRVGGGAHGAETVWEMVLDSD